MLYITALHILYMYTLDLVGYSYRVIVSCVCVNIVGRHMCTHGLLSLSLHDHFIRSY